MSTSGWVLKFDGAELAGEVGGTGSALVFLHAGVADARSWSACLSGMARTHSAVAYDRRGFGKTTYQPGGFSHLDDLRAVLDDRGIDEAVLIGNSMGGGLALDFALASPERCRALVLIGTAVSGAPQDELDPQTEAIASALEAAEEAGDMEEVNRLEARLWLDGPLAPAGRVEGELRALFLDMNGTALAAPNPGDERPRPPAYDQLAAIEVPTLVMVGTLDLPLMVKRSKNVAELLPRGEFTELAEVAHLPGLERPDLFLPVLAAFLERV